MRPHPNNRLIALGLFLAVLCINHPQVVAQAAAEAKQQTDTSGEAQSAKDLAALLTRLGANRYDLHRDKSGKVVSVALRGTNANNQYLALVSSIGSLQELTIQGRGRPESGEWTREGISCLRNLTNLVTLQIACLGSVPGLKQGVLEEICNLGKLKSLSLAQAGPQQSDYAALTNLHNLVELRVSWATNFGDAELPLLTNLVNLRSLSLYSDAVSRAGTNVLSRLPRLTNAVVTFRRWPFQ